VPFGITLRLVVLFGVLFWKAKRLLAVAFTVSPVMRWAVDEKVRLPELVRDVNDPVFGVVAPIGGIEAAMFVSVSL